MLCHQPSRREKVGLALHLHARVHLQQVLADYSLALVAHYQKDLPQLVDHLDRVCVVTYPRCE